MVHVGTNMEPVDYQYGTVGKLTKLKFDILTPIMTS